MSVFGDDEEPLYPTVTRPGDTWAVILLAAALVSFYGLVALIVWLVWLITRPG